RAIRELGGASDLVVRGPLPPAELPASRPAPRNLPELPHWDLGEKVATRRADGDALTALGGGHPRIVALDGEVGNSTYSEEFAKAFGDRFFEMYIAEQQMI